MARVNNGSHISMYLPLTLLSLSTGEMSHACLFFPVAERHRTLAGTYSRPTEGRRLSWLRWLVQYWRGLPAGRQSPIPVVPGIELVTIESQVQW